MWYQNWYTIEQEDIRDGSESREDIYGHILEGTGLGYHCSADEKTLVYIPTHIPSGQAIGPYFYREADARAFVEQIAPLTDWRQQKLPSDLIGKVKQIAVNIVEGDESRLYRIPRQTREFLERSARNLLEPDTLTG